MKINTRNTNKIEQALAIANKGCSARTVDTGKIEKLIKKAEAELYLLPKKYRIGCHVSSQEQIYCNSYKNRASSTKIELTRGGKDWYLTSCKREDIWASNSAPHESTLFLTDDAVEYFKNLIKTKVVLH